jgi:hypothetical protein
MPADCRRPKRWYHDYEGLAILLEVPIMHVEQLPADRLSASRRSKVMTVYDTAESELIIPQSGQR